MEQFKKERQVWKTGILVSAGFSVCACEGLRVGLSDSTKVIPKASPGGTPQIKSRKLSLNLRAPHLSNTHRQIKSAALCHGRRIKHMGGRKGSEGWRWCWGCCCLYIGWKYANWLWGPRSDQSIGAVCFIMVRPIWRSLEMNKQMAASLPSSWLDSGEPLNHVGYDRSISACLLADEQKK